MTIEENLSRLTDLLNTMEKGDQSLEEAFASFEEGIGLVKSCREMIQSVEARVRVLTEEEKDEE